MWSIHQNTKGFNIGPFELTPLRKVTHYLTAVKKFLSTGTGIFARTSLNERQAKIN